MNTATVDRETATAEITRLRGVIEIAARQIGRGPEIARLDATDLRRRCWEARKTLQQGLRP